jgi:hypothetical protein
MGTPRTVLVRTASMSVVVLGAYAGLLCTPQPLFPSSVRFDHLMLYSDQAIPEDAGKHVLELAKRKLALSPPYSSRQNHNVFICHSGWRQRLFFNKDYGAGGVAQYPCDGKRLPA